MQRLLCALAAACLGPVPALAQGFETLPLVREGETAPGTGGLTHLALEVGFAASSGGIVFRSRLEGNTASGLFEIRDGVTGPIVLEGDTAPEGETITSLPDWLPNSESGPLVYAVELTPGAFAVLRREGGAVTEMVRTGDPAPGTGGASFDEFFLPVANGAGDVAFHASLDPTGRGVFLMSGGNISPVVLQGETAPGTGGAPFDTFGFITLNDAGDLAFEGVATVGGFQPLPGIFAASDGSVRKVAVQGDPVPLGGTETYGPLLAVPRIDPEGTVFFSARFFSNVLGMESQGIFSESGGVVAPVLVGMDPAPARFGGVFGLPFLADTNDRGELAFVAGVFDANVDLIAYGLFVKSGAEIRTVVLQGEPVPGSGGGVQGFRFLNPTLNDRSELVFVNDVIGGSFADHLFLSRPATVPALPGGWLPWVAAALLAGGAAALVRRSRRP